MPIDLQVAEKLMPLRMAAKHRLLRVTNQDGKSKARDFSTVWRWATRGVRGVKLETARIGGTLVTTDEAIIPFCERLSAPEHPLDTPTPSQTHRAHRLAVAELEAAGAA